MKIFQEKSHFRASRTKTQHKHEHQPRHYEHAAAIKNNGLYFEIVFITLLHIYRFLINFSKKWQTVIFKFTNSI